VRVVRATCGSRLVRVTMLSFGLLVSEGEGGEGEDDGNDDDEVEGKEEGAEADG